MCLKISVDICYRVYLVHVACPPNSIKNGEVAVSLVLCVLEGFFLHKNLYILHAQRIIATSNCLMSNGSVLAIVKALFSGGWRLIFKKFHKIDFDSAELALND